MINYTAMPATIVWTVAPVTTFLIAVRATIPTVRQRLGLETPLLYAYDGTAGKVDTVKLTALNAANITLKRDNDDLLLLVNGTADSLRVTNHFYQDATYGYQIDKIQFADGTSWSQATIKAKVMTSTTGDDRLWGYAGNDTLAAQLG